MAMRRFLFFIVFLLGLGTITVHAQQDSIPTDSVLYQQAIQAFQNQRFRLKVNSYEDHVRPIKPVQSKSYVALWNGNIVISCYPGGWANSSSGWLSGGRVANYRMKTDKKGNLRVTVTYRDDAGRAAKLIFRLKQGSNHCSMTCNPIKFFGKFSLTGELLPYE